MEHEKFLSRFSRHKNSASEPKLRQSSELKTAKQKTAFNLLLREDEKAKKSRLESLLIQQYISKYGKHGGLDRFIKDCVCEFLDSRDLKTAQDQLEELEALIRNSMGRRLQGGSKAASNAKSQNISNSETISKTSQTDSSENKLVGSSTNWFVLNEIQTVSEEEKAMKEKAVNEVKKRVFKSELDSQIEEKKRAALEAIKEKERMALISKTIMKSAEDDDRRAKERRELILNEEREIRLSQIEANKQRRLQERQKKIEAEQLEMARSKKMAEDEEVNSV